MPEQLPHYDDEFDQDSPNPDESYEAIEVPEEPTYPESAFQIATAKIHEDLADYQVAKNEVEQEMIIERISLQVDAYLYAMGSGNYEPDDLPQGIKTLGSILRVTGQNEYGQLSLFPDSVIQGVYKEDPSDIDAMLADATETVDWQSEDKEYNAYTKYREIIQTYQYAAGIEQGSMFTLREKGKPDEDLPEYLKPLIADKDFAYVAIKDINSVEYGAEKAETPQEQMGRLRGIEREVLEQVCGIPADIAKQTRRAIETRTMKFGEDRKPIPMTDPEGGIDTESWRQTMTAIAEATKDLSSEDMQELYNKTHIVNYDRYTSEQLQRTLEAFRGNPETIKYLKGGDTTLAMADAFGDYNGAIRLGAVFDTDHRTIFTEINGPVAFYRPMVEFYKATGVKPSTVVIGTHGAPGRLDFSHSGFNLGVWSAYAFGDAPVRYAAHSSNFAGFMRKYTQPHSKTHERQVIMAACSQALPDPSTHQSLPEQLVELTNYDDKVVIKAANQAVALGNVGKGPRYFDVSDLDNPIAAETHEFRAYHPEIAKHLGTHAVRIDVNNKPLM